jgi:pyruvate/2-oxoglutarate dehydrogenase complex dihydrolipoamide acyltransferase (E2) component
MPQNKEHKIVRFPKSRIATFDICAVSNLKHYVSVMLELDITESRKKVKALRLQGSKITFFGWMLKCIATAINRHPASAASLKNRREIITFSSVTISTIIEKEIDGVKVPVPMIIKDAQVKSAEEISIEVEDAKRAKAQSDTVVLNKTPNRLESIYYLLPGFLRRAVWRFILRSPKFAFRKMGNVAVTSLGMSGNVNAWFIHKSIHPISFGIGSVTKKPLVVNDSVEIREVLNITILIDHDVIDGVPMAKFVKELVKELEG